MAYWLLWILNSFIFEIIIIEMATKEKENKDK